MVIEISENSFLKKGKLNAAFKNLDLKHNKLYLINSLNEN